MSHDTTWEALPLFPLGTVLFPGGVLPLRIFEVRYLDLIGRCHRDGTPFGVVALTRGSEVQQAPTSTPDGEPVAQEQFHTIGTLARIVVLERPQSGLLEIRCIGGQRFKLARQEKLRHGLWVGAAQALADDLPTPLPQDLVPVAQALGRLIERLQQQGIPALQFPIDMPPRLDDCGWVANRWCELLGLPVQERQRLMALDNPLLRLELVGDILQRRSNAA